MKRELLRVVLVCALILTFVSPRVVAAQAAGGGVTEAEADEARAAAAAFSKRLEETQDFAVVAREMFADNFMSHYLRRQARWAEGSTEAGSPVKTFMIEGVPALDYKLALAAREDDEHWPRLYAAANDVMRFAFLSYLSKYKFGGEDGPEPADDKAFDEALLEVYPPEAVKVLDSNPSLANFLKRKGRGRDVETAEDLRAVTLTMEEAARLTRSHFAARAKPTPLFEKNMRMLKFAEAEMDVSLVEDEEAFGYPKGTRIFKAFSSACYELFLIKEGGAMKVAWATFPHD